VESKAAGVLGEAVSLIRENFLRHFVSLMSTKDRLAKVTGLN
jgi:hypothetical protein